MPPKAPKASITCNWMRSNVTDETLADFVKSGYLPKKDVMSYRAPDPSEERPQPRDGEVVIFADHMSRGFAPFATATRHCSRSFSASSTAPGLPSNGRQDRRLEGHHSESHRLRQRRHSTAAEHVAAAASQPGTSRWREDQWGCNHCALSALKAKIADSPDPPRQRLHRVIRSTSSS